LITTEIYREEIGTECGSNTYLGVVLEDLPSAEPHVSYFPEYALFFDPK
jgi:hypothetical protein